MGHVPCRCVNAEVASAGDEAKRHCNVTGVLFEEPVMCGGSNPTCKSPICKRYTQGSIGTEEARRGGTGTEGEKREEKREKERGKEGMLLRET